MTRIQVEPEYIPTGESDSVAINIGKDMRSGEKLTWVKRDEMRCDLMATPSHRIHAHTEKEDGSKILIVQGIRFPTQTSLASSEACNETTMFNGSLMVELFAGKLLPYTGMDVLFMRTYI